MISFTIFFQNPDPSCSFLKRERAGRKGAGLYREESEEGGGLCIIDRREEAHREKGDMYLEKGMDGEGSLQYVGSGINTQRKDPWGYLQRGKGDE